MSKFTTESDYVWIQDTAHPHYPLGCDILEVLPENKYKVRIRATGRPEEILHEDQLSDDLIGG